MGSRWSPGEPHRAVIVNRDVAIPVLADVTVVEITSTLRTGLRIQVPAGRAEGLDRDSAANCDSLLTVPERMLVHRRGALDPANLFRPDAALRVALGLG